MKFTPDGFLSDMPITSDGEAIDEQTELPETIQRDTNELGGVARARLP